MALRERLKSSTVACSNVIDAANSFMTKTGVAVNDIFVSTMGFDVTFYMLEKVGVVVFKTSSPLQKIGLLLSAFNSVANPFVYVLLMPAFRDSLRKTFHLPTLRCGVVSKSAVVEVPNTESDTSTGGNEPATIDTGCQEKYDTAPATPKHVHVEMTPVTHTE